MRKIFAEVEKNHYKLFQITTGTRSVKVAVQKILTWGFDLFVDTSHNLLPYDPLLLYLKLCLGKETAVGHTCNCTSNKKKKKVMKIKGIKILTTV